MAKSEVRDCQCKRSLRKSNYHLLGHGAALRADLSPVASRYKGISTRERQWKLPILIAIQSSVKLKRKRSKSVFVQCYETHLQATALLWTNR
jgi:hypothetical protein